MNDNQEQPKKKDLFAAKASPEVIEKAYKLVDQSGLNVKEWFEAAVSAMEIQQLQGSEAEQAQDTQQVRYHVNRVLELFMNQVQKVLDLKVDFQEKLSEENVRHKGIADTLQEQKQKLQLEKEIIEQEIEIHRKRNTELEEQNKAIQEEMKLNAKTIAIIQSRNTELEEKIESIPKFEEEINALKDSFVKDFQAQQLKYQEEQQISVDEIQRLRRSNEELSKEVSRLQHAYELSEERRIRAEEEGERKVKNMQQVAVLQMEKAIAESDRKMFEQTQKLTEEWAIKERALVQRNETQLQRVHELEIKEEKLMHKNEELIREKEALNKKI